MESLIKDALSRHDETGVLFHVSPEMHARALLRAFACALAEYIYEEAVAHTPLYESLFNHLSSGESFANGCNVPRYLADVLIYNSEKAYSVIGEYSTDRELSRELAEVFGETLDYNLHRLMQI